jgi:CheY-like chemotaxis protein
LELITDVAAGVPEFLIGDVSRLRQIFINLLGNSIKFTDQGEVALRVQVETDFTEGVILHFSIRDTGIGVALDKQKLIFEAFSQADTSTTRKYGGTGLGLTITSRLVTMMGGRIWIESNIREGSTFHFTARFGRVKNPPPPLASHGQVDLRGIPVLVVDDNATNRRIMEAILVGWHMAPTLVDGGEAAMALLYQARDSGKPFRLVLTDMQMPAMDGFMLSERIKLDSSLSSTTIIMLTSAGQRGDAARCREAGIKVYLSKPIKQSDLRDAVIAGLEICRKKEEEAPVLVTRHSLRETRHIYRVLLAEDNPMNQTIITRFLEKRGHTVVVAHNGRKALDILGNGAFTGFDFVLMDVQMPEMDGLEATRAIRTHEKSSSGHLPVIALTARAMKGDEERCLEAGMDGYLTKPVRMDELFEMIEKIVDPGADGVPILNATQPAALGMERASIVK